MEDKLFNYINKNFDIVEKYHDSFSIIFDWCNYNDETLKIFKKQQFIQNIYLIPFYIKFFPFIKIFYNFIKKNKTPAN
jgi:hypothetical protein